MYSKFYLGLPMYFHFAGVSLVAQTVRNLPAMQETPLQSLGWEDPLEEGIATHSSMLVCRNPWTEEPGRLQSMESQKSWTQLSDQHTYTLSWRAHLYSSMLVIYIMYLVFSFFQAVTVCPRRTYRELQNRQ